MDGGTVAAYIWLFSVLASICWALYAAKFTKIDGGDVGTVLTLAIALPISIGVIAPLLLAVGICRACENLFNKLREDKQ